MAHIIKILEGFSFIPRKEQTLLEALEQQNVAMEYQCREGFCGSCQVSLVNGEVTYTTEAHCLYSRRKNTHLLLSSGNRSHY